MNRVLYKSKFCSIKLTSILLLITSVTFTYTSSHAYNHTHNGAKDYTNVWQFPSQAAKFTAYSKQNFLFLIQS